MNQTLNVRWPPRYQPERCPVYVRNELDMAAAPEDVWSWLIRASQWPDWYSNSGKVRFLDGSGPSLSAGARFRWKTFGVTITSCVREFIPNERIAWDARNLALDVYHGWVLHPSPRGCRVLTEETQLGGLANLGKWFTPERMYRYHQVWLTSLEAKARSGPCPE